MRLYCTPGRSSQAPHIALRELGIPVRLIAVDLHTGRTAEGEDFIRLNPFGTVPLLMLDNEDTLREVPAILRFVAGFGGSPQLLPPAGTVAALRTEEWLGFLSSELHARLDAFSQARTLGDAARLRLGLMKRFAWIDLRLATGPFLTDHGYSVADIYLWVLANWARAPWIHSVRGLDLDLAPFDNIRSWHARVAARPAVCAALAAEAALA